MDSMDESGRGAIHRPALDLHTPLDQVRTRLPCPPSLRIQIQPWPASPMQGAIEGSGLD